MPKHYPHIPAAQDLLALLNEGHKPLRLDQILRIARVERRYKAELETLLHELAKEGRLLRMHGGQWVPAAQVRSLVGRYSVQRSGAGFVDMKPEAPGKSEGRKSDGRKSDGRKSDGPKSGGHKGKQEVLSVFVHPSQAGDAWHGDTVRVALLPGRGGKSPEGRIVEVLERGQKELAVRVLKKGGSADFLLCKPADGRFSFLVRVDVRTLPKVPGEDELLLVRPGAQLASDLWAGEMLSSFGREDDVAVQEQLVKLNHQAPSDFPQGALDEAAALPDAPAEEDLIGREDVRQVPFVTIDGDDARDFDDAVHVEKGQRGGWRLRVGIADVTHYVRPRSRLDEEARVRGNSWYFPRSVEPMLPKALSNGLCSLNPHVDRLIMLADMEIDAGGGVHAVRFAPAVLRSAARLTYGQVKRAVLEKDPGERQTILEGVRGAEVLPMLEEAEALARVLAHRRKERGSLDFNLPEPQYVFDAQGRITDIRRKEQHFAHQIIEEFMITANEAVARFLEEKGAPFLYRVHPEPEEARLSGLFRTLASTDLARHLPPRPDASALQLVLREAKGGASEFLVGRLALRTMPQARYQPENEGHFGLASPCYCHFTSPIRRYADVVVHRALKHALGLNVGPIPTEHKLFMLGDQLNRCERAAMEAEREMARRLATLVLRDRVGESFDGIVASVTDFGIFVELDSMPVEGMVRVSDLGDDYFEYDPERQELTGMMSGLRYYLGQALRTKLVEVNPGRLEITLALLELPAPSRHAQPRRRGGEGRTGKGGERRASQPAKPQKGAGPKKPGQRKSPTGKGPNPAGKGRLRRG